MEGLCPFSSAQGQGEGLGPGSWAWVPTSLCVSGASATYTHCRADANRRSFLTTKPFLPACQRLSDEKRWAFVARSPVRKGARSVVSETQSSWEMSLSFLQTHTNLPASRPLLHAMVPCTPWVVGEASGAIPVSVWQAQGQRRLSMSPQLEPSCLEPVGRKSTSVGEAEGGVWESFSAPTQLFDFT